MNELLTVPVVLFHTMLTLGVVYTISESVLVLPLRHALVSLCPKPLLPLLVALLYCTRCLGFWVGAAIGGCLLHGPWTLTLLFGVFGIAEMHVIYGYFITQSVDPWVREPKAPKEPDEKEDST